MAYVQVLLFSVLREKVGQSTLTVRLPRTAGTTALLDQLAEMYPVIETYRDVIRVAVNRTYSDTDTLLNEGDEVALITPVSGG